MNTAFSIIGKGGLYTIIKEILADVPFAGYYDDTISESEEWLDTIQNFKPSANTSVFIAIAAIRNMLLREKLLKEFGTAGCLKMNAVSKQAYIAPSARLGNGNIVSPFVCVHSNVVLGEGCVFFSNTVIEHDCILGSNVNMGPGVIVAGSVRIGSNVFVGAGSVIKDGIRIGDNTIIGAGSVILQDIPANVIAYGTPGKVIRENKIYRSIA